MGCKRSAMASMVKNIMEIRKTPIWFLMYLMINRNFFPPHKMNLTTTLMITACSSFCNKNLPLQTVGEPNAILATAMLVAHYIILLDLSRQGPKIMVSLPDNADKPLPN